MHSMIIRENINGGDICKYRYSSDREADVKHGVVGRCSGHLEPGARCDGLEQLASERVLVLRCHIKSVSGAI